MDTSIIFKVISYKVRICSHVTKLKLANPHKPVVTLYQTRLLKGRNFLMGLHVNSISRQIQLNALSHVPEDLIITKLRVHN